MKKEKKKMCFMPLFFLPVIRFCIMFLCCRISTRVSEKPCYCTNWNCSMCLKQNKKNAALTALIKK